MDNYPGATDVPDISGNGKGVDLGNDPYFPLSNIPPIESRSRMSAMGSTHHKALVYLTEDNGEDIWQYYANTNFAVVLGASLAVLDPNQRMFVPPVNDPTGALGAWVRKTKNGGICPSICGAKFDGVTNDTQAWQEAVDLAERLRLPIQVTIPRTTCLITGPLDHIYGPTSANANLYRAVRINSSNLTIDLGGCTVRVGASDVDGGTRLHYMFATDKNMVLGTLENFKICNGTIDVNPTTSIAATPNPRGLYLVGIDGITIENILFTSGGLKNGSGMSIQNSRNITLKKLDFYNITQGGNFSYIEDFLIDTLHFDTFTEALDFDHRATRGVIKKLTFRNALGSDYQCLDFNSVQDVTVDGITVQSVGNIAYMNYKQTTPPTFAEWVAWVSGVPVSAYTPSKNITISNVRGDTVGIGGTNTFYLGQDQIDATQTAFPNENLTLRDVKLTNCSNFIWIEMSKNFLLEDVYMDGLGSAVSSFGAVSILSDFAGAGCSGTIRNSHFKLGASALRGIKGSNVSKVVLDNVTIEGNGTNLARFFDFVGLDTNNAFVSVDRCTAKLNGDTNCIAWSFGDGGVGPYTYAVKWGEGNRILGAFTTLFAVNGTAYMYVGKQRVSNPGKLAITAGTTFNIPLITTLENAGAYIMRVTERVMAARALDATNFVNRGLRSISSAGATATIQATTDSAAVAANANSELITANNRPSVLLGANAGAYVLYTPAAAGRTLDGISLTTSFCDFLTV